MRHFRVEMGGFQPWMYANQGELTSLHSQWTQQPQHWSLFFFSHSGSMAVNNKPHAFEPGWAGFVVPGTKVEFDRVGEGTHCRYFTFELIARAEAVAIPAVADLRDSQETRERELQETFDWLHVSIMRGLACCFNTLWTMAKPMHILRKSDLIYDAEALIVKGIAQPITIPNIARELGISHSHLLRLFREEHHCTVQQFVRDKRGQIARQLIMSTDRPLKEIAAQTGMSDLQYFNKVVKSAAGMSPRELRQMAENRTRH